MAKIGDIIIDLISPAFFTILGGLITYVFSIRLVRKNQKEGAAKKLRNILQEFLVWVMDNENIKLCDDKIENWTLERRKQEVAAMEFCGYLCGKNKEIFDKTWAEYSCPDGHKWGFLLYRDFIIDGVKNNGVTTLRERILEVIKLVK